MGNSLGFDRTALRDTSAGLFSGGHVSTLAGKLGSGSTGGRVTVHAQQSSAEESRVGAPTSPPRRGFPTPPAWPQCSWDADKRDLKAGFFSLRSNSAISCTPKKIFNTPSVIVGRTATRSPRNALPSGNALPL